MLDSVNASRNGKRRKSSKNGNEHSNGHSNGKSNGKSLLVPLLPYELTKIETVTKEYDQAQANYQERVDKLKKKQSDFKQDYKTQIEIYKKVIDLKKDGISGNISEESTYTRIKDEFEKFKEIEAAIQKYKVDTVNAFLEKKQSLLQNITDARRKRQVELNKQGFRRDKSRSLRVDTEVPDP